MKTVTAAMLALSMLAAGPALAATEFECLPGTAKAGAHRSQVLMSDDLIRERKQAREAELARLRERLARGTAAAQPVAAAPQPAEVR